MINIDSIIINIFFEVELSYYFEIITHQYTPPSLVQIPSFRMIDIYELHLEYSISF